MIMVLLLGLFIALAGVALLVAPNALAKASQFLNRKVFDDSAIYAHRILGAIICIMVGCVLLLLYFNNHATIQQLTTPITMAAPKEVAK